MWGYILIMKFLEKDHIYYYTVYKKDNEIDINYFIGLDPDKKKIYFFEDQNFDNPLAIYDLDNDQFEKLDPTLKSLINGRVIVKALKAIRSNTFPDCISWYG